MQKQHVKIKLKWKYSPEIRYNHYSIPQHKRQYNHGDSVELSCHFEFEDGKLPRANTRPFDKGSDLLNYISIKSAGFTVCNENIPISEYINRVHSTEFWYVDTDVEMTYMNIYKMNKAEFKTFLELFTNGHKADKSKHPAMIMYLENKIKEGH